MSEARNERTEEEIGDLKLRLEALSKLVDISHLSRIDGCLKYHTSYIDRKNRDFLLQFKMCFSQMGQYACLLNYLKKETWTTNKTMQFIIATRSLKQFYSAYYLLVRGMYEDSIVLLRGVYESFLRIAFISIHPDDSVNVYPTDNPAGFQFKASNFVKQELNLDWESYEIMSTFVHSNQYDFINTMFEAAFGAQDEPICLDYKIDDVKLGVAIGLSLFLLTAFLGIYDQFLVTDNPKQVDKSSLEIIGLLHSCFVYSFDELSGQKNEYWRVVAADLSDIYKLMRRLDEDNSLYWKEEWQSIRKSDG